MGFFSPLSRIQRGLDQIPDLLSKDSLIIRKSIPCISEAGNFFAEAIGAKTEESGYESGESQESDGNYEQSSEPESHESSDDYEGGQDSDNFGEEGQ